MLRLCEPVSSTSRTFIAHSPCCRSMLRDAIRQARHRQLHTSTSSRAGTQTQQESWHIAPRARNSWTYGQSSGSSGRGRSGRGRWQHSSSSRVPPSRTAWLLLPLSLSKIHLDDNGGQHNTTVLEKAQDLYEHAKDLTLNEKASLLEEGEQLSLWDRFLTSIHRWIIEPLGTARRFLYLAILFIPVIITAPILTLELLDDKSSLSSHSRKKKQRQYQERSTTIWWYRLLVRQMERAGPTFIKVSSSCPYLVVISSDVYHVHPYCSLPNGPAHAEICSLIYYVTCSGDCTRMAKHIL